MFRFRFGLLLVSVWFYFGLCLLSFAFISVMLWFLFGFDSVIFIKKSVAVLGDSHAGCTALKVDEIDVGVMRRLLLRRDPRRARGVCLRWCVDRRRLPC